MWMQPLLLTASFALAGPDMDRLLRDIGSDDDEVAHKAADILIARGKKDPTVSKALVSYLKKGPHGQRHLSASVLGRIGDNSRPAIPALTRIFLDDKEDDNLRSMCASALAMIGRESADVFRKAMKQKSTFVRRKAMDGLGRMAVNDASVVPDLIAALADPDSNVRSIAQDGLTESIRHSRPLLEKSVNDQNPYISVLATETLLHRGMRDRSLVDKQVSYLNHASSDIRYYAIGSLWHVKDNRKDFIPALTKRLEDTDGRNREDAIRVLASFGDEAKVSLGEIRKCLRDKEFWVRYQAVLAISRLAKPDPEIAKELIPLLVDDEHPDVVGEVIPVLGSFGRQAKVALPALERVQKDIRFRDSARIAIEKIDGK